MITLGTVLFDAKNRKLIMNGKTIDLTETETRVLLILALSPNETIERSWLQKEIWEDEGVIVGRSLDMLGVGLKFQKSTFTVLFSDALYLIDYQYWFESRSGNKPSTIAKGFVFSERCEFTRKIGGRNRSGKTS